MIVPSNAIIISLGDAALQMTLKYQRAVAQRHADSRLPSIRVAALLEEGEEPALPGRLPSLRLAVDAHDRATLALAHRLYPSQIAAASDPAELSGLLALHARPRGQVALQANIEPIVQLLRELRRALFVAPNGETARRHGLAPFNARRLDVYLLLSLTDSFMSGLLPDLPFVVRQVLQDGAPDNARINISLILALPGFHGELNNRSHLQPSQQRQHIHSHAQTDVYATAAATLREVDYFLANAHAYRRRYNAYFAIDSEQTPLSEGRIYLLEPTNEQGKTLKDFDSLATMVADWLYTVTLTSVRDEIIPSDRSSDSPYASFGYSTLRVPIEKWIERVAAQQQMALLDGLLSDDAVTKQLTIAQIRQKIQLTESDLTNALTERTMFAEVRLQASAFRTLPLAGADLFLNRLQNRYTELMTQKLPETRGDIHYRKRQLTSKHSELEHNSVDKLEQYVLELLDIPNGGIIHTHHFLESLRDDLREDRERLSVSYQQQRLDAEQMGRRVSLARQQYLAMATIGDGFRSLPFANLAMLLAAGLAPILFLFWHWANSGVSVAHWITALFLLALSIAVGIKSRSRLGQMQQQTVEAYDARLTAFRDGDLQEATIQLYDDLIQWIGNLHQSINRVWQALTDIRTGLQTSWEQLADPHLLTGVSDNATIEHLMTIESLLEVERALPPRNRDEFAAKMRQTVGSPSLWIQNNEGPAALGAALHAFVRDRVIDQLRYYDIHESITNVPPHEMIGKLHRVFQNSAPYWRVDQSRTPLLEDPSHLVIMPELALDVERLLGADLKRVVGDDRYAIVMSSLRQGLDLHQITIYSQLLARAYERAVYRDQELLHTTTDRLALPTPRQARFASGANDSWPTRQLYAVACALGVIDASDSPQPARGEDSLADAILPDPVAAIFQLERDEQLRSRLQNAVERVWRAEDGGQRVQRWIAQSESPNGWLQLAARDVLSRLELATPAY